MSSPPSKEARKHSHNNGCKGQPPLNMGCESTSRAFSEMSHEVGLTLPLFIKSGGLGHQFAPYCPQFLLFLLSDASSTSPLISGSAVPDAFHLVARFLLQDAFRLFFQRTIASTSKATAIIISSTTQTAGQEAQTFHTAILLISLFKTTLACSND